MLKSNSLCEQIARTCGWTQVNGQIYKLLEKASADGDEPNALYANDWEEAYLLACGNSTAEDGSPTQREYSFDIKLLQLFVSRQLLLTKPGSCCTSFLTVQIATVAHGQAVILCFLRRHWLTAKSLYS